MNIKKSRLLIALGIISVAIIVIAANELELFLPSNNYTLVKANNRPFFAKQLADTTIITPPKAIITSNMLPSVDQIQTSLNMLATDQAKFALAQQLYGSTKRPLFLVLAVEAGAIAMLFFSPEQASMGKKLLTYAENNIAQIGSLGLYGLGQGLAKPLLEATEQDAYNLYVKPIMMAGIGLVGMSVACTVSPDALLARGATSIFEGMTMRGAQQLALNAINKGYSTRPAQKVLAAMHSPEGQFINNGLIIMGTLGLIAAAPLLLTYAGTAVAAIAGTQATAAIAASSILSALEHLEQPLVLETAQAKGEEIMINVKKQTISFGQKVQSAWKQATGFFASLLPDFDVIPEAIALSMPYK